MGGGQEFDKQLTFEEFMYMVLQLRGSAAATVQDIVDLKQFIFELNISSNTRFAMLESDMEETRDDLQKAKTEREHLKSKILDVHKKAESEVTTASSMKTMRYAQYFNHHR